VSVVSPGSPVSRYAGVLLQHKQRALIRRALRAKHHLVHRDDAVAVRVAHAD
jgi:hypothetical protein